MPPVAPTEIFFRCTACRGRLAVPVEHAGKLAECPACRSSLLVPAYSTAWPPGRLRLLAIASGQVVLVVLLGLLAWNLINRPEVAPSAPVVEARAPTPAPSANPGVARVRAPETTEDRATSDGESYRALQTAHQALSRQYEELANWVLGNMRGRILLKDKFAKNLSFPPLTDEYLLHPDLMEFLEVSPRERDLLEDALGFGLSTMATLETRFLSVTQAAPDRVAVHVPPYEQEGAAMQDDLYRAMETVLGSDRFGRLMDVGEPDLVKRYHYFGAASRTMVFQQTPAEDPQEPPYLVIRDGWIIPDGVGKRSIQVAEVAVRELPRDYLPYLSWLPDFVAAYAQP